MNKKIICQCLLAAGIMSGASLAYADDSSGRGYYVGAFAGMGRTDNQDIHQTGTAYKYGSLYNAGFSDFDVHVDVSGNAQRDTAGLGGIHGGYEWGATSWGIKPAIEIEAYYLHADQKSNLANANDEIFTYAGTTNLVDNEDHSSTLTGPDKTFGTNVAEHYSAGNHRFANSMKLNGAVFMANGVFTYETHSMIKPYVGLGVGFAYLNMSSAQSLQTSPASGSYEMAGPVPVNHFNSNQEDSTFVFAAQTKLGLRAELTEKISAFGEYRLLHLDSADYTFGSTNYPGLHSPTSVWNVSNGSMNIQNIVVGIDYAF